MDTSTISFSNDVPDTPRTLSSPPERPEPGSLHTRLVAPLSPLTKNQDPVKIDSSSAVASVSGSRAARGKVITRLAKMPVKVGRYEYLSPSSESASRGPTVKVVGNIHLRPSEFESGDGPSTVLIVFIPILVVVLTVLLGVLIFLIALLCMKRQKGIRLAEDGGPLDLSKGDGVIGEGGVEGVEQRWLENTDPDVREAYLRAKGESHSSRNGPDLTNAQTGKGNTHPRPSLPILHYPSSSLSRKRVSRRGRLSQTTRRTSPCMFNHAPRSRSSPMVLA